MACEKCRSAPKSTKQRESRTSTSISCWFLTFLRKKMVYHMHWLIIGWFPLSFPLKRSPQVWELCQRAASLLPADIFDIFHYSTMQKEWTINRSIFSILKNVRFRYSYNFYSGTQPMVTQWNPELKRLHQRQVWGTRAHSCQRWCTLLRKSLITPPLKVWPHPTYPIYDEVCNL